MINHVPTRPMQLTARNDGWENLFTGAGVENRDPSVSTAFKKTARLSEQEYRDLYEGDGFARRVVDLPISDMTREGFEITNDPDGDIIEELERLDAVNKASTMLKWGSVFGGGIGVVGLNDGQDLDKPLSEARLKSVEFIHVFDRYRTHWSTADLYSDPNHPKFGQVEYWKITPHQGVPFVVHESRCLRTDGVEITDFTRQENNGWGDSVYKALYDYIRRLTNVYGSSEHIVGSFVETMLKIDGLADLIAAGKEDVVKNRLQILDLGRHIMNTVLIDSEEEYEKKTANVTGLDKLIDRFQMAMSSVTGIPVTVLFGRSAAGMDSTGDADFRMWYDKVADKQRSELSPILEPLIRWVQLAKQGPFRGTEIDDWEIKYCPLWQPTDKEMAEQRKLTAETDDIYIANGTVAADEIRESRFGGDEYSMETSVEGEMAPLPEPEPEEDDNFEDE